MPFRVLQVITPSHMSGAETQLVRMVRRMRGRGHELPVLVKRGSSVVADMQRHGVDPQTAAIGGKANLLAPLMIGRVARRNGVQLIQSALSTASWWCGWLESLGGPPSLGHVHGFTSAAWHRRQRHLLAVSQAVADDLIIQGVDPERITVLPNAIDPAEFQPTRPPRTVREELGAEPDTPVVAAFGHLSEKKGYRDLFEAIPQVLAQAPRTQFWIVGRGALETELRSAAFAGGFADRVRFTGFRRDAADVMNACDVLALPSHREPFGLVYIEAATLGKPAIACRAGGAIEAVADGETGLLVPPRDAIALAEAMLTLLTDAGLRQRMGAAGRKRTAELFSWQRYTNTLEGVYQRLVA
ncbi:MAG: hypothetical protein CMJ58_20935 [Planctomycetaceae bacterium]|nr:hypothetical protein [Planctomycetaceae bacterium]